ncbi:PREDICTED: uncharacterized protein LOC109241014 [Nicotiana attenuata]|uniref:uncharacterized protein LOC109241014 n=1 Tax=Nicotiana attenuata TaxID=49451 RepID=UPI000904EA88|nr:PREDICTED: uncharacterized protein LOC109241014 [Nicotiana attenuata]
MSSSDTIVVAATGGSAPPPNQLITINPASQPPLKLTGSHNFSTWKAQHSTLLIGYDLMGYVNGTELCSPQFLISTGGSRKPNPAYKIWTRQDSLLQNAIMASVDCTIAPMIANVTTAALAWKCLHTTYANKSQARIFGLREQLSALRRNSKSIADFMGEIKSLADELAATGSPLTSEELTIKVLSGLGPEFKEISAAIRSRDTPLSFEELYDKLLGHEVFLKHEDAKKEQLTITAQLNQRNSSNSRPRSNNFNTNRKSFSTNGQSSNHLTAEWI